MTSLWPWLFFVWFFGWRALIVLGVVALLIWAAPRLSAVARRRRFLREQRTQKINPRAYNARYQLGVIYRDGRQYEKARVELEEAVSIYDESSDAHGVLGDVYLRLGRHEDAVRAYTRALELNPSHGYGLTHAALGRACQALGRHEEAREWYEKSVARNQSIAEPHYRLGRLFERVHGDTAAAAEAYDRAVAAARHSGIGLRARNRFFSLLARLRKALLSGPRRLDPRREDR